MGPAAGVAPWGANTIRRTVPRFLRHCLSSQARVDVPDYWYHLKRDNLRHPPVEPLQYWRLLRQDRLAEERAEERGRAEESRVGRIVDTWA